MFKKTLSNGYFKKRLDSSHIGLKHLPVPSNNAMPNPTQNSNTPKVSSVLQKSK